MVMGSQTQRNGAPTGAEDASGGLTCVRPASIEDIAPGMYVTVMREVSECVKFWALVGPWSQIEMARWERTPERSGTPLRVVGVCVPFVLVERVGGSHRTLDVRRHRLAVLPSRFGAESFRRLRDDIRRREARKRKDEDD
jgi:hypothetical protein